MRATLEEYEIRRIMTKFLLLTLLVLFLGLSAVGQNLPDAPQPQPVKKCGPWSCWNPTTRPTKEVFKDKTFLAVVSTDAAVIVFDNEMTHEGLAHHKCVEGNPNLPMHPSRGQLYASDLPEFAVVSGGAFLFTKLSLPKWLTLSLLPYPVEEHLRGGIGWAENCW